MFCLKYIVDVKNKYGQDWEKTEKKIRDDLFLKFFVAKLSLNLNFNFNFGWG